MSLSNVLVCCLMIALTAGCKAQTSSAVTGSPAGSQLDRKIELLVRSQFDVPPNVGVKVGAISKSDLPGYGNLPITFSSNGKQSTLDFLLSNDGNTLARLEKFDLSHNPSEMIPIAGRPIRGAANAKVTIINFDDLECPYCARMHEQLFPGVFDHYRGLIRFVYKDYPLVQIHPWAMHAAIDAGCLSSQNDQAYWNFVDYVHSHVEDVTGPSRDPKQSFDTLDKLTRDEGRRSKLDLPKLDACVVKQDESSVRASMKLGDSLGVNGTPTLFINGERISGALPTAEVEVAIDRALTDAGVPFPPQEAAAAASPAPAQQATPQNK